MKSATWTCIISAELAISVIVAAAIANQWYGLDDPPTCRQSRSTNTSAQYSGYSPKQTPPTAAPKSIAPNSTPKCIKAKMFAKKYSDKEIVAATICAEAGGEPWAGQVMVGEVIANRAINGGMSVRTVCLAPKQFSCWNNRGTMEIRMQTMRRHPAWADCLRIAESICQKNYKPVSQVTHYFNPKKANPKWARGMKLVAVVGKHRFYTEG